MDALLFLGFLTTTLLFVAVPGPSVAFASAQAVRHGTRAAVLAVAGDGLGTVVHIAIALGGVVTLIALSDYMLPVLQIAGGAFIVLMGIRTLTARPGSQESAAVPAHRVTFWAGFFACVTNPKAIVFFAAFFPTFISPDHDILLQGVVYGAVFLILDGASILAYALLAMHAARQVQARWFSVERLSGMALMGVGLGMVVKGVRALPSD